MIELQKKCPSPIPKKTKGIVALKPAPEAPKAFSCGESESKEVIPAH